MPSPEPQNDALLDRIRVRLSTQRVVTHRALYDLTRPGLGRSIAAQASMTGINKCLRPACSCPVTEGEKYCSVLCENAGPQELPCNCGHHGCALQAIAEGQKEVVSD